MIFSISKISRAFSALLLIMIYSSSLAFPSILAIDRFEEFSAGTTVRISLPTITSSGVVAGQTVTGTCPTGVTVKGVTFVSPGAPVKLRVSSVVAPKGFGKPGSLSLDAVSVTAVDGTEVPLTGGTISAQGEDKNTQSLLLGLFICFLFLFQKGGEASYAAGATLDAFVANSVDIEVK